MTERKLPSEQLTEIQDKILNIAERMEMNIYLHDVVSEMLIEDITFWDFYSRGWNACIKKITAFMSKTNNDLDKEMKRLRDEAHNLIIVSK